MTPEELELAHRTQRPDGTQGPVPSRPWARWDLLARGDMIAGVLAAFATLCCAGALFFGPPDGAGAQNPAAFVWIAPLVGAVLFIAQLAMFAEENRHGVARALLAGGALALAIGGVVFNGEVPAGRLIAFYWLPAILSISAALTLMQAKKVSHDPSVPVRQSGRPLP